MAWLKKADNAVAMTIIQQLGGIGKLQSMIGANSFVAGSNDITFRFNGKSNYCTITLEADDTYSMEIGKITGDKVTRQPKIDDIYNDNLIAVFEEATGMKLSL